MLTCPLGICFCCALSHGLQALSPVKGRIHGEALYQLWGNYHITTVQASSRNKQPQGMHAISPSSSGPPNRYPNYIGTLSKSGDSTFWEFQGKTAVASSIKSSALAVGGRTAKTSALAKLRFDNPDLRQADAVAGEKRGLPVHYST